LTREILGKEMTTLRWTSRDLEMMPDNGKRYEIVDGELYVSKQPHYHHQRLCLRLGGLLDAWCLQTGAGEANAAPGLIFGENDDVAPDLGPLTASHYLLRNLRKAVDIYGRYDC
jgi:hypothetical protein